MRAIRAAFGARVRSRPRVAARPAASRPPAAHAAHAAHAAGLRTTDKIIAIGASTGGPAAIERVLQDLPVTIPGAIIVQHMPLGMTRPFAARLAQLSRLIVREARDGDRVAPGVVLVAPAGVDTSIIRSGSQLIVRLKDGPRIHHQRPAVDVLFHSVAEHAGPNAIGVLLTGMGEDGAAGLRAMRDAGATTIAESEETCVVFGMPRAAIAAGGAARIVPLGRVPDAIVKACATPRRSGLSPHAVPRPDNKETLMSKLALVVDDSLVVRKLLSRALKSNGFEVIDAANGKEALAKAKGRIQPDHHRREHAHHDAAGLHPGSAPGETPSLHPDCRPHDGELGDMRARAWRRARPRGSSSPSTPTAWRMSSDALRPERVPHSPAAPRPTGDLRVRAV